MTMLDGNTGSSYPKAVPMEIKMIASNRRATHEYTIGDVFEAGLVLTGTEVKAARSGKVNLADGWVNITDAG